MYSTTVQKHNATIQQPVVHHQRRSESEERRVRVELSLLRCSLSTCAVGGDSLVPLWLADEAGVQSRCCPAVSTDSIQQQESWTVQHRIGTTTSASEYTQHMSDTSWNHSETQARNVINKCCNSTDTALLSGAANLFPKKISQRHWGPLRGSSSPFLALGAGEGPN